MSDLISFMFSSIAFSETSVPAAIFSNSIILESKLLTFSVYDGSFDIQAFSKLSTFVDIFPNAKATGIRIAKIDKIIKTTFKFFTDSSFIFS